MRSAVQKKEIITRNRFSTDTSRNCIKEEKFFQNLFQLYHQVFADES